MRVRHSAGLFTLGVMLPLLGDPATPAAEIRPRVTLGSPGHNKPVVEILFSPDGKTLTSRDQDGNVVSRDVATGAAHLEPDIQQSRKLVFSADRRLSASVVRDNDHNNSVEIRDQSGKHVTHRLQHPTWPRHGLYKHEVVCMTVSTDGKLLVTGGIMTRIDNEDRNGPADAVRLWDVATGAETKSFDVGHAGVRSVALSGDGKTLAAGTRDGIKVWDVSTGKERFVLGAADVYMRFGSLVGTQPVVPAALAIGPAGRTLVAAWGEDVIAWDLTSGAEWRRETAHRAPVTSLAFSPTGRCFASGDAAGDVRLWVIGDWVQAVTQPKPAGPKGYEPKHYGYDYGELTSVVMSADGKSFAFGGATLRSPFYPQPPSDPGTAPLAWVGDVATGVTKAGFYERAKSYGDQTFYRVERLALGPDGTTLAAYTGTSLWLEDTAAGAAHQVESGPAKADAPRGPVHAFQFTPNGKSLLVRDGYYTIKEGEQKLLFPPALRVLDRATGRWAVPIAGQKGPGVKIDFEPRSGFFNVVGVIVAQDRTSLSQHGAYYAAPAEEGRMPGDDTRPSPRDDAFPAPVVGESIGIWRTDTGALVSKLPGRFNFARPTLSPDGGIVAIQGRHLGDPKIGEEHSLTSVWQVATGKLLARMSMNEPIESRPAISPDNNIVAEATRNGLHVWSATGGEVKYPLTVSKPAFLPDNKTLVAIRENDIVLIDATTGNVRDRLVGHARPVIDYALTPDGKSLVSIGQDRTVRLWDLPAAARGR